MVEDFCSKTTVHGVRYFTEGKRHWVERSELNYISVSSNIIKAFFGIFRAWWILAFIASVYLCSEFIRIIWKKWEESPVIVRFDNKVMPIKAVPFPAMTICPMTKIRSDLFNFTQSWITMTHGTAKPQNMSAEE